jgi:hypothetical protein
LGEIIAEALLEEGARGRSKRVATRCLAFDRPVETLAGLRALG